MDFNFNDSEDKKKEFQMNSFSECGNQKCIHELIAKELEKELFLLRILLNHYRTQNTTNRAIHMGTAEMLNDVRNHAKQMKIITKLCIASTSPSPMDWDYVS